jgi:hypothetical protein
MENGDVENRSFEMQGVSAESRNMHLVGLSEEADLLQSPRMQRTVANFGDDQDSSHSLDSHDVRRLRFQDLDGGNFVGDLFAIDEEVESLNMKKPVRAQTTAKRNRAAEVHYLSEQRQSDRMNKQMKSLQELIPNSYKRFKVEELRMVHQSSSKGISMIFCPSLPHVSLSVQLFSQSRKTFSSSKLQ